MPLAMVPNFMITPMVTFMATTLPCYYKIFAKFANLSTYTFLHIGATTREMLQEFKRVVNPDQSWIQEDELQGRFINDIPKNVVMACKSSISQSLSTLSLASGKLSDVQFVPRNVCAAMPYWDSISWQEGEVHKVKRYGDLEEVLRCIEKGIPLELGKTDNVQVKVGHHPFINGAS
ncbi:hypothetical protein L7F22_060783 [Adiantum nelumboides]|nr:hypothetical protein [Adiantum nelumboides]